MKRKMDNRSTEESAAEVCPASRGILPPFPFQFVQRKLAPTDILWHFTSMDALLPILKTGFWAKHSSCQSDKLDCSLRNKLRKMWCRLTFERDAIRDKTSIPKENLRMLQKAFVGDVPFPSFITCFSHEPNFEAMWEHYGVDGGISIGCRYGFIASLKEKSDTNMLIKDGACGYFEFDKCLAYLNEIDSIVEETLKVAYANKGGLNDCEAILKELSQLEKQMLFVKRSIFSFEHEWRLIHTISSYSLDKNDDSFHFPDKLMWSNGKLVFDVKVESPPNDWIEEIKISPFGNAEENYRMALLIAHSFGIDLKKVTLPITFN